MKQKHLKKQNKTTKIKHSSNEIFRAKKLKTTDEQETLDRLKAKNRGIKTKKGK